MLVIKSELSSNDAILNILANDQADAAKMSALISDFISRSESKIMGETFDQVRNHLDSYISLLNTRSKLAEELAASIKSANSQMSSFMEDEEKIDENELPNLRSKASSLQNNINYYNSLISQTSSQGLKNMYYGFIDGYRADLDKIKKKIERREKLPSTDSSIFSTIDEVASDVSSYKGKLDEFQTIK